MNGRDMDRNVPGGWIFFELIEYRQPRMIGKLHIEQNRIRKKTLSQLKPLFGALRDHTFVMKLLG